MAQPRDSRWWTRVDRIAAAIAAAFVAAALLAKAAGAPPWALIVLAALGFAGAGTKIALVSGGETAAQRELRDARLADRPRRIRTMMRPQLYLLGVDPEAPEALEQLGITGTSAAYQARDADAALRASLAAAARRNGASLVVLTGRSKAGKSRCALEAVLAVVRDGWLLVPAPVVQRPAALGELARDPPALGGPVVIWLDDLESWARPEGLTTQVLQELDAWGRPVIVLATAFGKGARAAGGDRGRFEAALHTLLDQAQQHPLLHLPTERELADLESRFGATIARRMQGEGIGEFLIAARHLVRRLENEPHPVGQAIVRAAIDIRRTGYVDPIPHDWLSALHGAYHHTFATEADYDAGLRWATDRIYANTGLLNHSTLGEGQHVYEPYDYLVDYASRSGRPIPRPVWGHVIAHATAWLANVGVDAHDAGEAELAERAFRKGDRLGDELATFNLGVFLRGLGDLAGAEAAYRRADARGSAQAPANLGVLLQDRGDLEGAEAAYRRGDERGDDTAAHNLGVLLRERGDLAGAEAAYRRSEERGNRDAPANLGVLLQNRGDLEGAEAAYRRGDERGNCTAAHNLGVLLQDRGDLEGAEAAYRRADERGDVDAAFNLALMLQNRRDLHGAEAAYRRADERGDRDAAFNLALLLWPRGDLDDAEAAYRRADERGHALAAYNLSLILRARGDLDGAAAALARARDRDLAVPQDGARSTPSA